MTADEFKAKTGYEPQHDDLERVNCDKVGQTGHTTCGWCARCDGPMFHCGHSIRVSESIWDAVMVRG